MAIRFIGLTGCLHLEYSNEEFGRMKNGRTNKELVRNPTTDLFAQIPHGKKGHTILREILLIADHNAYHIGQIVLMRRMLKIWD